MRRAAARSSSGPGSYLSGSIHLMSDVELHLGPGSTVIASSDGQAYDFAGG